MDPRNPRRSSAFLQLPTLALSLMSFRRVAAAGALPTTVVAIIRMLVTVTRMAPATRTLLATQLTVTVIITLTAVIIRMLVTATMPLATRPMVKFIIAPIGVATDTDWTDPTIVAGIR